MSASTGTPNRSAVPEYGMPEGQDAIDQVAGRKTRGRIWLSLFLASLIIAILALIALLFNIINGTVGLAAVENAVDPDALMTRVSERRMVSMPNTTATEDDEEIAAGVAADPNAIGFFGFSYFDNHRDTLQLLPVEGVLPDTASVESGAYALARPLYLYVNRQALTRPDVSTFVYFYVANVNATIEDVGYFPVSQETIDTQLQDLINRNPEASIPVTDGTLRIAGSSTVLPLTQRMLQDFIIGGFAGTSELESAGTRSGFARLCNDQDIDIANASRAMTRQEVAFCNDRGVDPIQIRVGTDAIAMVTNPANTFLTNVTQEQAQVIFTEAIEWNEVDNDFPQAPIVRYIPGLDSGTLNFFASEVFDSRLEDLTQSEMLLILQERLSAGVYRRFDSEKPLADRSERELLTLIEQRVIQPKVVSSYNLTESILRRDEIETAALEKYPDAVVQWWRWLDMNFLTSTQSSVPDQSGVRTAILGSLWVILLTMLIAVPIGIGSAIYLEEYAGHSRMHQLIQTNIDNLAGVPSIIYGILGLTVFVRVMEPFTSGARLGVADATTANGRTIISAALTLALLVLPVVIINAQEAIRAVPRSLREAGYGLGATKWQVTWTHVLSNALPGIFTGTILAMSRALGETAPLIVVGASTFITTDPTGPFSKFTVLPMQIYQWTSRPQDEFRHIAAAASVVLIVMLLLLNGTAIFLRNRYGKKL